MRAGCWLVLLMLLVPLQAAADSSRYRGWLEEMREQPRGPFERIRWFCNDGTVLPPKAYACRPHGGGVQHGGQARACRLVPGTAGPKPWQHPECEEGEHDWHRQQDPRPGERHP